jgi:hypothetical protein
MHLYTLCGIVGAKLLLISQCKGPTGLLVYERRVRIPFLRVLYVPGLFELFTKEYNWHHSSPWYSDNQFHIRLYTATMFLFGVLFLGDVPGSCSRWIFLNIYSTK